MFNIFNEKRGRLNKTVLKILFDKKKSQLIYSYIRCIPKTDTSNVSLVMASS